MASLNFERIIGEATNVEKSEILKARQERFDDQFFETLRGKERDKSTEELQLISRINGATNQLRERYGLPPLDVPPANIHIIAERAWPKGEGSAFLSFQLQAIFMRDQPANIVFAKKAFHEMLHFKSYRALQITVSNNPELQDYRLGLTIKTRDGKTLYFRNLNEAVTEELTKRFILDDVHDPLFFSEWRQTESVRRRHADAVTTTGRSLWDDDTYYAGYARAPRLRPSAGRFPSRRTPVSIVSEKFTYKRERSMLETLITKLWERNPGRFESRSEIFDVFARAMFVGNLVPLGRLIERTFGRGTFKHIAELDGDLDAQELFVANL